ncbi:MAG: hypothetical protein ACR2H2_01245 [Solirubrobacteraceae bacterium]
MTTRPARPGPQSLAGLQWLARVGASPGEPLALVMGWGHTALHKHLARLIATGLVWRIPMTRGEGSLLVVTRDGARIAGAHAAPRGLGPTSWAHAVACAWTSAWFEVRGRDWLSTSEVAQDDGWRGRVAYTDGRGRSHRLRHTPDLGTYVGDPGRPVAVEVELQRKSLARLQGILAMYADRTMGPDGDLAGVVYITGTTVVAAGVRTAASAVQLDEHPGGRLRVLALGDVITQTRDVARAARAIAEAAR